MEVKEDEQKDQVGGLKKFRKIGRSVKMVTSLTQNLNLTKAEGTENTTLATHDVQVRPARTVRRAAIADSTATDQAEIKRNVEKIIEEKTHRFVLHPHSSFRFYWDLISIIILMINVVTIPLGKIFEIIFKKFLELSFYLVEENHYLRTIKEGLNEV